MAGSKAEIKTNELIEGLENQPFFIAKKTRLDSIKASPNVKVLVLERAQDDDTYLPMVPSAQTWRNMTDEEKDEFVSVVTKTGKKWTAYENDMMNYWPKGKL